MSICNLQASAVLTHSCHNAPGKYRMRPIAVCWVYCMQRLSLGTLVAVAVYDSVHMARISRQQQELQSEAKLFRAKLRESPVPQSGA